MSQNTATTMFKTGDKVVCVCNPYADMMPTPVPGETGTIKNGGNGFVAVQWTSGPYARCWMTTDANGNPTIAPALTGGGKVDGPIETHLAAKYGVACYGLKILKENEMRAKIKLRAIEPKVEAVKVEEPVKAPRVTINGAINWEVIAKRFTAGESMRAMAGELGVTTQKVYHNLRALGVTKAPRLR